MRNDKIIKIEIDESGRLLITPESERFTMNYRSASEVHWDFEKNSLYSPKPREWTYLDWFKNILSVVEIDYNCKLIINDLTEFINLPESLETEIKELNRYH